MIYSHGDREDVIRCIGTDNKQHVCFPWEKVCCCGVTVKRKILLKHDHELYSCYECTF